MSNFRIEPNKLIESGIDRVKFDPSKVKLDSDEDYNSTHSNTATRSVRYSYGDAELGNKILGLGGYCIQWSETKVVNNGDRWKSTGLYLARAVKTQLRKRPNKSEFTQKSLDSHAQRAKVLDDADLAWATEQFKIAVEHFNAWYVDEQVKKVSKAFSSPSTWNFKAEADIEEMEIQLQELALRRKLLKKKVFDRKCDLMVQFVKDTEERVSQDFKQPIIEAIIAQKSEGESDSFFG
tara:strand:+ start:41754 stop:42461 length:708 start_codon:yes stop_codon:yes gene_type:complete